jgi:hypothetical protein
MRPKTHNGLQLQECYVVPQVYYVHYVTPWIGTLTKKINRLLHGFSWFSCFYANLLQKWHDTIPPIISKSTASNICKQCCLTLPSTTKSHKNTCYNTGRLSNKNFCYFSSVLMTETHSITSFVNVDSTCYISFLHSV